MLAHRSPLALLVDLDDTILDWSGRHEALESVCVEVASALGLDAARLLLAYRMVTESFVPSMERSCWLGELSGAQLRTEVWRRALLAADCPAKRARAAEFATRVHREAELRSYRIYPDAQALLLAAAAAALPVAIVTNGAPDTQRDKLRLVSRTAVFAVAAVSGEVGVAKPDPRLFLHACAEVGCEPSDVWHIGDSLTHDVGGAQAAGIPSIWINRNQRILAAERPKPWRTVADLGDVAAHLGHW